MWSFLPLHLFSTRSRWPEQKRINSCINIRSTFFRNLSDGPFFINPMVPPAVGWCKAGHGGMAFLIPACSFLLLVAVSGLRFASGSYSFLPWRQRKWHGSPSQEQAGYSRRHPDRNAKCGSVDNWAVWDPNVVSSPELTQEHRLSSWHPVNHALSWKTSWYFNPVLFSRTYLELREGTLGSASMNFSMIFISLSSD